MIWRCEGLTHIYTLRLAAGTDNNVGFLGENPKWRADRQVRHTSEEDGQQERENTT